MPPAAGVLLAASVPLCSRLVPLWGLSPVDRGFSMWGGVFHSQKGVCVGEMPQKFARDSKTHVQLLSFYTDGRLRPREVKHLNRWQLGLSAVLLLPGIGLALSRPPLPVHSCPTVSF